MARKWWTLAAVCTGVFMLLLDITIVNVALPDIERGFHASLSDLQWVIDAYALTLAAFLLTAGFARGSVRAADAFAVGIAIFTLGSLACALATSSLFLASRAPARVWAGRSCSRPRSPCSPSRFSGDDRGVAFGAFGAVTGVAIAVGPVLGGALTSGRRGVGSSTSTSRSAFRPARDAAARRRVARPERDSAGLGRLCHLQRRAGGARLRPDPLERRRLGVGDSGRLARRRVVLLAGVRRCRTDSVRADARFGLLRVPTFNGGLIAAWAISASIFSALTFLILYMQNILGLSAVAPASASFRSRGRSS